MSRLKRILLAGSLSAAMLVPATAGAAPDPDLQRLANGSARGKLTLNFVAGGTVMQVYYRCRGQRGGRLELRDGRRTRVYNMFCDDRTHHLRNVATNRGHGHRIDAYDHAGGTVGISVWGARR